MSRPIEHLVDRGDSAVCWGLLASIVVLIAYDLRTGGYLGAVLGVGVLTVILGPSGAYRSTRVLVPWEVLFVAVSALLARQIVSHDSVQFVGNYLVIASIALVVAVEIHAYTRVEMNRTFATAFVAMVTMSVATGWTLGRWLLDVTFGSSFIPSNEALMWELIAAAGSGIGAGVLFDRYFRRTSSDTPQGGSVPGSATNGRRIQRGQATDPHDHDGRRLSRRLGLSERRQRQFVLALQLGLAGTILFGIVRFDVSLVLTGVSSLGITFLPAILRRDPDVSMDVGLALWISVAVFLHTMGTVYLYDETFWWHNVTHAVSGSLVAALGYGTFRGIDEYTNAVRFPSQFMFVLILLFVLSVGVLWEITEFATDRLMLAVGSEPVLAQYGLADTMTDMLFNTLGAVVVAAWGTAYLTGITTDLRRRVQNDEPEEGDRT